MPRKSSPSKLPDFARSFFASAAPRKTYASGRSMVMLWPSDTLAGPGCHFSSSGWGGAATGVPARADERGETANARRRNAESPGSFVFMVRGYTSPEPWSFR